MNYERQLFAHYIKTELKLSKSTVDGYERDIRQLCLYLEQKGIVTWVSCTQALVLAYIDYLRERGTSPSSLQRKISAIRRFFIYLKKYRHLNIGFLQKQILKTKEENTVVLLHSGEIARLLSAPDIKTEKGVRDRAMFELLCATGIKVTELICLEVSDVMLESAAIRLRHVNGMRIISFKPAVKRHLKKYMQLRNALLTDRGEKAFFLNMSGERLTRQGFNKILGTYAAELHLKNRITPNAIRFTFANKLMQNGLSLEAIKDILGHADLSTTKAFLKSAQMQTIKNKGHKKNLAGDQA